MGDSVSGLVGGLAEEWDARQGISGGLGGRIRLGTAGGCCLPTALWTQERVFSWQPEAGHREGFSASSRKQQPWWVWRAARKAPPPTRKCLGLVCGKPELVGVEGFKEATPGGVRGACLNSLFFFNCSWCTILVLVVQPSDETQTLRSGHCGSLAPT